MTDQAFRALVREMRAAQQEYFRERTQEALRRALDLEHRVDLELSPSLFDDPVAHG